MNFKGNLYLVGPMGAGKSTVGRIVAERLSVPFFDLDLEIERRSGVDIPTIFEFEGEEGFRRREREALRELSLQQGVVVATGGGAVLLRENRQILRRTGFVVYLLCPVEVQLERTAHDTRRPLLQVADRATRLEALLKERDPLYREVADLIVPTGHRSSWEVAEELLERLVQLNVVAR